MRKKLSKKAGIVVGSVAVLLVAGGIMTAKVFGRDAGRGTENGPKLTSSEEQSETPEMREKYAEAEELFTQGQYGQAVVLFRMLGTYKDSEEFAKECWYYIILEEIEDGEYKKAERQLKMLGTGYKDVEQRLILVAALRAFEEKEYETALTGFQKVSELYEVQDYIDRCGYKVEKNPLAAPYRDLGGVEYIIGDFWSPEDEAGPPGMWVSPEEQYREELFEKYNFTIREKAVAGWGEMIEVCTDSILSGEPAANLFELEYRFIAKPLSSGCFYDLATLSEFDFTDSKWNQDVLKLMTFGDSVYGMRVGVSEPTSGIIWNKQLFEEAGLDPELPYDLQASGEWTWSKFKELCEILTRDIDNDGATDVYATVSQGSEMLTALVFSTGEDFVGRDARGMFYNNTDNDKVKAAIDFAVSLYTKGYEMPQPENSQWDYFQTAFREGEAAMTFSQVYMCEPGGVYGDWMDDEVGFVMTPKPDGQDDYGGFVCDNIVIIPSCYDEKTASDIAFAYNLYTATAHLYDSEEEWKADGRESYYAYFDDERAVDESIAIFDATDRKQYMNATLINGFQDSLNENLLWTYPFSNVTQAEQVEAMRESWDALIAETNKRLTR